MLVCKTVDLKSIYRDVWIDDISGNRCATPGGAFTKTAAIMRRSGIKRGRIRKNKKKEMKKKKEEEEKKRKADQHT